MSKYLGGLGFVLVGLIGMTVLFGSWFNVGQNEMAVMLRNGAYVSTVGPGLHFKTPMIEDFERFSTLTITKSWDDLTPSTKDLQPTNIKVSLTYHIDGSQVEKYYTTYGRDEETVVNVTISPKIHKEIGILVGQYTAAELIGKQAEVNTKVEALVRDALSAKPVVVDSIQIEKVGFSPEFTTSIEQNVKAQIDADREKKKAEGVKNIADGEASATQARATAEAFRIKAMGDAEAAAIEARGKALKDNPDLPNLIKAERWDGKLPTTMIPGGTIPMLNMGPQGQ